MSGSGNDAAVRATDDAPAHARGGKRRSFRNRFAGLSRNTFLLAAASLFGDFSTEMFYPILPVFITQTLKASASVVGVIDGVAQAVQNVGQGVFGVLSDRLGRRKPFAVAGYLVAALAKPLMGIAPAWPFLLGARVVDRLGTGARLAPRDAMVTSSAPEADRGRAFGLEGLGDNIGAFLGPLLAAAMLYALHASERTIFYAAIVPGLLAVVMIAMVEDDREPSDNEAKTDTASAANDANARSGARHFPKDYWKCLAATALFGLGNCGNAFLILRTQDLGASLGQAVLIYAAFNLFAALISYPAGALSDRWGRRNVLLAAQLVFLVVFAGLALAKNLLLVAALFALLGVYQGMFRTVGRALAEDFAPDDLRASGVGWYGATVGLLQLAASVVAGLLWDHVGHAAVFVYGAVFAVAGSVGLVLLVPREAEKARQ